MNFYYTDETGGVAGPVSRDTLQKLVDAGQAPPDSQVCYEGSEEWKPLSTFIHATAKPKTNDTKNAQDKTRTIVTLSVFFGAWGIVFLVGFCSHYQQQHPSPERQAAELAEQARKDRESETAERDYQRGRRLGVESGITGSRPSTDAMNKMSVEERVGFKEGRQDTTK